VKHCPKCQRTYTDELRFCLDDGAWLSITEGSAKTPATLRIDPKRTDVLPRNEAPRPAINVRALLPWTLAGAATLLLVIMGIVLILVIVSNHRTDGTNVQASSTPTPRPPVAPIQLAGTTWTGIDSTGESKKYEFSSNGTLNNDSSDRWQQSGNTVTWQVNNGYSHYTGTITNDRIEYSAYNQSNLKWTGWLTLAK
jgi:hypothetical protein